MVLCPRLRHLVEAQRLLGRLSQEAARIWQIVQVVDRKAVELGVDCTMFARPLFERPSMMFWHDGKDGASAAKTDDSSHNPSFLPLPTTIINLFPTSTVSASKIPAEGGFDSASKPSGSKTPKLAHPQPSRPLNSRINIGLSRVTPFSHHDTSGMASAPALPGKPSFKTSVMREADGQ